MMRWAAAIGLSLVGCRGVTVFVCSEDEQCGAMARCEPQGYCSFEDESCPSGSRFGEHAGDGLASRCVPEPKATTSGTSSVGSTSDVTTQPDPDGGSTLGGEADTTVTGPTATNASGNTTSGLDTSSDDGTPTIETCNGMDDDGDGIVDEVSDRNTMCDGCSLAQVQDVAVWICRDDPLAWSAAAAACEARGAQLATIEDPDLQIELWTLADPDWVWIGANDLDEEGTFRWVDGSLVMFTNWQANQPDNSNVGQHCVQMTNWGTAVHPGGWDDTTCNEPRAFVCTAPHVY